MHSQCRMVAVRCRRAVPQDALIQHHLTQLGRLVHLRVRIQRLCGRHEAVRRGARRRSMRQELMVAGRTTGRCCCCGGGCSCSRRCGRCSRGRFVSRGGGPIADVRVGRTAVMRRRNVVWIGCVPEVVQVAGRTVRGAVKRAQTGAGWAKVERTAWHHSGHRWTAGGWI